MRGLSVRRFASTAVCATFVLGIAAPTALAADRDAAREHTPAVAAVSVPGAHALLDRAERLGDLPTSLAPVGDLVATALTAEHGRLTAGQAQRLGATADQALAATGRTAPAADRAAADAVDDALAALSTRIDALLAAATSGDVAQILPAATGLVSGVLDLLTAGLTLPDLSALPEVPALPDLPVTTPALPDLPAAPPLPVEAPALPPLPATS